MSFTHPHVIQISNSFLCLLGSKHKKVMFWVSVYNKLELHLQVSKGCESAVK